MKRKSNKKNNSTCVKDKTQFKITTTEELLTLMNIYYAEWEHRDSLMWQQVCTFFFAVFVIILLPFATIWDITLISVIPSFVFPATGMVLSVVFLYITLQYAKRLSKSSATYRELIECLPEEFQRKHIHKKEKITAARQLAYIVPWIMFVALLIFGTLILCLCLGE